MKQEHLLRAQVQWAVSNVAEDYYYRYFFFLIYTIKYFVYVLS